MNEAVLPFTVFSAFTSCLAILACNTDVSQSGGGSTQGEDSNDDDVDPDGNGEDADSTAGDGEDGEDGAYVPCGYEEMLPGGYAIETPPTSPAASLGTSNEEDECFGLEGIHVSPDGSATALPDGTSFDVYIYHPQGEEGEWPEGLTDRPAVFFAPARDYDLYVNGADVRHRGLLALRGGQRADLSVLPRPLATWNSTINGNQITFGIYQHNFDVLCGDTVNTHVTCTTCTFKHTTWCSTRAT